MFLLCVCTHVCVCVVCILWLLGNHSPGFFETDFFTETWDFLTGRGWRASEPHRPTSDALGLRGCTLTASLYMGAGVGSQQLLLVWSPFSHLSPLQS